MNKIFTFKKIHTGLNYDMITVNLPLTVKICSINPNQNEMDLATHSLISDIIEGVVREELVQRNFDGILYHTFEFLKDICDNINANLKISEVLKPLGYYVVDLYIGDDKITDDANYILNMNKYFENSKY
jgi:hypothetical protein